MNCNEKKNNESTKILLLFGILFVFIITIISVVPSVSLNYNIWFIIATIDSLALVVLFVYKLISYLKTKCKVCLIKTLMLLFLTITECLWFFYDLLRITNVFENSNNAFHDILMALNYVSLADATILFALYAKNFFFNKN